jgi:signal transduction histidine kinase
MFSVFEIRPGPRYQTLSPENRQAVLSPASAHKFELIDRISAGLAHELNGPIGIAMGFSELAKEAIDGAAVPELSQAETSKVSGYLDMIETASLRARNLSRGIWNFAKAEPSTIENFNVVDLLDSVQHLKTPAVKVAQIDVARREDPAALGEAITFADAALTQQILVELFLASPESIPGGGLVVWQVSLGGGGSVEIDLVTEPWNEVPASEWEIPEYVRESFNDMGGSISVATPTPVVPPTSDTVEELTG